MHSAFGGSGTLLRRIVDAASELQKHRRDAIGPWSWVLLQGMSADPRQLHGQCQLHCMSLSSDGGDGAGGRGAVNLPLGADKLRDYQTHQVTNYSWDDLEIDILRREAESLILGSRLSAAPTAEPAPIKK
jgi:hypothetical protein